MKLKHGLMLVIMFTTMALAAQTYVDIPWREGSITMKNEKVEGMIRLGGNLEAPWLNHSKVYFVPSDKWVEGKRPKKKAIKEYKPEDIQSYSTYTETADGIRVNMNFVSREIMVMGTFKKKKRDAFLKVEEEGAINMLSYIPKPTKKIITTADERYNDGQNAIRKGTLYLEKNSELHEAAQTELVEFLKDCPSVVEKINSEEYGFKPKAKRKKKKGLGKMISKSVGDNVMESKIMKAVSDYNNCVK